MILEEQGISLFTIVPIIVGIGFVIVIGILITRAAKGLNTWTTNNNSPILTVPVAIVAKRTEVSGGGQDSMATTSYYATFELEDGERVELRVSGKVYGSFVEGDNGTLTYQGTRYHQFERKL
ncbi:DUF2500 domain-containing protein [Rummeliibacillus stabekisii]|uniref:DUF2500 domain-containing protein n=1 Tax=Rummeliibacillus stabekisii TaxID=241244 RepID=A0A143HEN9_9BACL|nr:DUF2500 domain-containing protein [Rummeliibacillus stabekisii]AMX00199.1 hypothetical protein ATY39_12745 [Rummeliibacillus stabekisii]